ncbi:hypothetical protein NLI96_g12349 [Meripilus lineatus]|uniref:DUF6532 domain-containing protein n=1 Tax=Meripilus lineatus TaxID=2056292 RepID=A0AAD5Y9Z0_9APHY|nr:hypothetical protein NLI96_g12349 [Physisporinus lineatus]
MANSREGTSNAALDPSQSQRSKRHRSAIESEGSDVPKPKRTQQSQALHAQGSPDADDPAPSSQTYNLNNKHRPGKVYKRATDELRQGQAQKEVQSKALKAKSPAQPITRQTSTILSGLTRKYLKEQEGYDVHDTYHPHQPNKDFAVAYLSPPSSEIDVPAGTLDDGEGVGDHGRDVEHDSGGDFDEQAGPIDDVVPGTDDSDRTGDEVDRGIVDQDGDITLGDGSQRMRVGATDDDIEGSQYGSVNGTDGGEDGMDIDEGLYRVGHPTTFFDEDPIQDPRRSVMDGRDDSWTREHPWELPPDVRDWKGDFSSTDDEEPAKKKLTPAQKDAVAITSRNRVISKDKDKDEGIPERIQRTKGKGKQKQKGRDPRRPERDESSEIPTESEDGNGGDMDTSEDEEFTIKKAAPAQKKRAKGKAAKGRTDSREDEEPKTKKPTPSEKRAIEVNAARERAFGEEEKREENTARETHGGSKKKEKQKKQKVASALNPDWRNATKKQAPEKKKPTHRRQDSNIVGGFDDDNVAQDGPSSRLKDDPSRVCRQVVGVVVPYQELAPVSSSRIKADRVPQSTSRSDKPPPVGLEDPAESSDLPEFLTTRKPTSPGNGQIIEKHAVSQASQKSKQKAQKPTQQAFDGEDDADAESEPDIPVPPSSVTSKPKRAPKTQTPSASTRKLLAASSNNHKPSTRLPSTPVSGRKKSAKGSRSLSSALKSVKSDHRTDQKQPKSQRRHHSRGHGGSADEGQFEDDVKGDNDGRVGRKKRKSVVKPEGEMHEWQKQVVKDSRFRATIMHYFGLLKDPWVNNISKTQNRLPEIVQKMVKCLYKDVEFTVADECPLVEDICVILSDWRSYFFKVSARVVQAAFLNPELGIMESVKGKWVESLDAVAVAKLAEESITDGKHLYGEPDSNPKLCKRPYQSHFVLETFVCAHQKKIEESRLSEVFDPISFPFPYGALELATYAVHIAFQQYESGELISARFSKTTNIGLWEGHCANIQHELSRRDQAAFLTAAKRYRPRIAHAAKSSRAFSTVPKIRSRKSQKDAESGGEIPEEGSDSDDVE